MEEVTPGIVKVDQGTGDLHFAAGVSSCCVPAGNVATKALTVLAALEAAAVAYIVFEGNHFDMKIRFVSMLWILP